MVPLKVSAVELAAATPVLGERLERWQGAVRDELSHSGPHAPYIPEFTGPVLTGHSLYVNRRALDHAYAALLSVRSRLQDRTNQRDGLAALRALEPVMRAVEEARDEYPPNARPGQGRG